jgi:hypothetical protein
MRNSYALRQVLNEPLDITLPIQCIYLHTHDQPNELSNWVVAFSVR